MADPYAQPSYGNLICRLTTGFSFTNERQSPQEVCQRLTGNPQATDANGRLNCGQAMSTTGPSFNPFGRTLTLTNPSPTRPGGGCNWVRLGGVFVCI